MEENENEVWLYTAKTVDNYGNEVITGYAYGAPWVAQALFMDDIKFDTPEEARAWWEKNYGMGG
jgi:hypothetical protein